MWEEHAAQLQGGQKPSWRKWYPPPALLTPEVWKKGPRWPSWYHGKLPGLQGISSYTLSAFLLLFFYSFLHCICPAVCASGLQQVDPRETLAASWRFLFQILPPPSITITTITFITTAQQLHQHHHHHHLHHNRQLLCHHQQSIQSSLALTNPQTVYEIWVNIMNKSMGDHLLFQIIQSIATLVTCPCYFLYVYFGLHIF